MRYLLLRGIVLFGAAVLAVTELLSPFHLLQRAPLAAAWTVLAAAAAVLLWKRRPSIPRFTPRLFESAVVVGILAIVIVVGITAVLSPPNSADAMAYHMPRVVYWAQSGSVAFFPTPYFNQISLPPLDEYFLLHAYVLTGGDHLSNLVAFGAFLGSLAAVVALAGALGLKGRGQATAALFAATLPSFILQASGAKNDCLLTLWLVALAYFVVRRDVWFAGLALGLAVATKSTAFLFAPPIVAALWLRGAGTPACRIDTRVDALTEFPADHTRRDECLRYGGAAILFLLLNAPQFWRNFQLAGSPIGYDSAQGDGFFRWRNEHPGVGSTVSNALRHFSEQLGARDPRWNQAVYGAVVRVHSTLGLDPQDPDTTFRWSHFAAPVNANHEANANNRWHLLLAAAALLLATTPGRRRWLLYGAGLAAAFLLFCFYLKWQPFMARLELPLFVLAAPLAGMLLEWLRPAWLAPVVCLFLAANARLPLLENWTRPLRGPHSLFATARDDAYFNDMGQWNNRDSYRQAVDLVAKSGCGRVGLDISENQLEYPFLALLRERRPDVTFVHTGVENPSTRFRVADEAHPCGVLCLDCAGNTHKLALYAPLGTPETIGRFVLILASQ